MSIRIEAVTHVYLPGTPQQVTALDDVSLEIADGEFLGLIGPTGSGKSTLVQTLNGLLRPTRGRILVDGQDIWERHADRRKVRQRVGLIFQYPEHQLFEETVFADVAFGPRNLGLGDDEVRARVTEALRLVGLEDPDLLRRSPFSLSGGQMRRVAIAGVLAMRPQVLVLDEPAAGLDPAGRREILGQIRSLHRRGLTVVLVSHNMEDIGALAQRVVVLHQGRVVAEGTPEAIFGRRQMLLEIGLGVPPVVDLLQRLAEAGCPVNAGCFAVEGARDEILRWKLGTGPARRAAGDRVAGPRAGSGPARPACRAGRGRGRGH